MDTYKKIREHISALSDGELSTNDVELAFAALQTADGQHAWNVYHRIGDALRAQATPELSGGFADRLAARLAQEPDPVKRPTRSAHDGGGARLPSALGVLTPVAAAAAAAAAAVIDGGELADAQAVANPKPAIVTVS